MKHLILFSFLSLFTLNACGVETDLKQQTANHIARPAFMVERTIGAGPFGLQAWERMHKRNTTATVYIEGDSPADKLKADGSKQINLNPFGSSTSPDTPVGLLLASRDQAENLVHLSRPCQYMHTPDKKGCNTAYTQAERYAPEVLDSYEAALNDIAARYSITKFHLVGYDGGANIAGVLAARRGDVLTLRTVAGDLNPRFADGVNTAAPVAPNAVLAIDFGSELAKVAQHHFVGAADEIVTPGTYHSYRQAIGLSDCIHYSLIQDADHVNGWTEKWPQLNAVEPQCATLHNPTSPLPELADFPGNFHKGKGFSK